MNAYAIACGLIEHHGVQELVRVLLLLAREDIVNLAVEISCGLDLHVVVMVSS